MSRAAAPEWLLWLGLAVGAGLALAGLVVDAPEGPEAPALGQETVAVVDGVPIPADRYFTALAGLATSDRAPKLSEERRRVVLDDLVAEELLLQRAITLDLVRVSQRSRRQLVREISDVARADADAAAPTGSELREWYAAHPEEFAERRRYEVRAAFFRGPDAEARAAAARLAIVDGADPAVLGDPSPLSLPQGPLGAAALRNYLGPTATRAVRELTPGQTTAPIRVAGGYRVIRLDRAPILARAPFDEVESAVRARLVSERSGERLRAYVAGLRRAATVDVNTRLLDPATPIPVRHLEAARAASGSR